MALRVPPRQTQQVQESLPWYEEALAALPAVGLGVGGGIGGALLGAPTVVGAPAGAAIGAGAGMTLGAGIRPNIQNALADTTTQEIPGQDADMMAAANEARDRRRARFQEISQRWA